MIMPKSIQDTGKFEVSIVEIGRRRTLQLRISSMDLGICDVVYCIVLHDKLIAKRWRWSSLSPTELGFTLLVAKHNRIAQRTL